LHLLLLLHLQQIFALAWLGAVQLCKQASAILRQNIFAHFVLFAASPCSFPDLHLELPRPQSFGFRMSPAELHNQIITILSLNTKNLDVFLKFIFLQHFYGLNLIFSNVNIE